LLLYPWMTCQVCVYWQKERQLVYWISLYVEHKLFTAVCNRLEDVTFVNVKKVCVIKLKLSFIAYYRDCLSSFCFTSYSRLWHSCERLTNFDMEPQSRTSTASDITSILILIPGKVEVTTSDKYRRFDTSLVLEQTTGTLNSISIHDLTWLELWLWLSRYSLIHSWYFALYMDLG
jgi:hypothetical protein